jgi:diguanylate cyclase (GGDEF)-like protein
MGLLLVVAVLGGQALHGDVRVLVVDGSGIVAVWISAVVCWMTVSRVGFRRGEVLLATIAVTSFSGCLTYLAVVLAGGGPLPLASPADAASLLFYPLMLAALVVAVRHHSRGLPWSVWLDCAVGSLGAATVLAVVLSPVLVSAQAGPPSLGAALAVAFPMLDLLLVAAVAGLAALGGRRMGSRWPVLVVGLMAFAGADMVIALERNAGTFVAGTSLDAGWGIGLALTAMWVVGAGQGEGSATRAKRWASGAAALVVSAVATTASLGVLLVSSRAHVSTLAVTLAGVTLLGAGARTQLAFRHLGVMADQRKRAAATDELTGLPNRYALYAEGHALLSEPTCQRAALLVLDLDKFKEVNDSLGHHAGDLLLIQVGDLLREHLRAGDVLARLGGDEFAVLLDDVSREQATEFAVALRAVLAESFTLEGITLHCSVSVGIALFPEDGSDLGSLLRKADIAMYKAKVSSSGQHLYAGSDDADDGTRLRTVEELRTALVEDQLVVHYQPKVDLGTGEVHSAEALVRWNHPRRGLLYPDAFLTLVEDSGLMPALSRVVLTVAMDQAATWQAQGQELTIAVNLSASSLVDDDLPDRVTALLAARELPPHVLQLEITEEFLMADRDRAREILTRLRRNGIQISIDDYGTGYSSLSYLRDLPIDELKLDRSFIAPMADDARAAALVASTVALAHGLGMRMVAEGVETSATYAELARLGCDQAQGYLISRPVPASEFTHWLGDWRAARRVSELPRQRVPVPVGSGAERTPPLGTLERGRPRS